MNNKGRLIIRLICYFGGMLIMTLGVAISVKSVLGVSPVSSIPYTITVISSMDLGLSTTIFSVIMALLQIPILRKKYQIINLLQIPVSIVFGLFMTSCVILVNQIPEPTNFVIKLILALISTIFIAIGVFLYVSANFIPLPPEGFTLAISQVTGIKFGTMKVIGDIAMVVISLITCLILLHSFGSIGIGTVLAAILVGNEITILSKFFKNIIR